MPLTYECFQAARGILTDYSGLTDTDDDGLYDFEEINFENDMIKFDSVYGTAIMPTFAECMSYMHDTKKIFYVDQDITKYYKEYPALERMEILPIKSNPNNPDSDGDNIADGYLSSPIPGTFDSMTGYWNTKYANDSAPLRYSFKYYDEELYPLHLKYPKWEFEFEIYDFTLDEFVSFQYESGWNLTSEENYKASNSEQSRLYKKHGLQYAGMFFPNKKGLEFYCNPMTYLDDIHVFAFYDVRSYSTPTVNDAKKMLQNTYFDQGEKLNQYAQYFVEASLNSGLDMSFIISKCLIECGANVKGHCSKLCAGNIAPSAEKLGLLTNRGNVLFLLRLTNRDL